VRGPLRNRDQQRSARLKPSELTLSHSIIESGSEPICSALNTYGTTCSHRMQYDTHN